MFFKESEEKLKVECSQNVSPILWGCWLIKIQKKKKNRAFADLKYAKCVKLYTYRSERDVG